MLSITRVMMAQELLSVVGHVQDFETGNPLPFCTVKLDGSASVVRTDDNGRFNLRTPPKKVELIFAYIGYTSKVLDLDIKADTTLTIKLPASVTTLDNVVVSDERFYGENQIEDLRSSTIQVEAKDVLMIPGLAGEPDLIRTMQLLPGVTKGVEGSVDFFVRGGDADQNLVLLDDAIVYNSGHLFGFMSVFNPDMLGDVQMIKGGFPAYYGGRLSSVIDIKTNATMPEKTTFNGSVGVISSNLTIAQPIIKDKLAVKIAGRRTYIDQLLKLTGDPDLQLPYYFYDFNGRIDFKPSPRHSFYFSNYFGADILDIESDNPDNNGRSEFDIENANLSFGWKYLTPTDNLISLIGTSSRFSYLVDNSFEESTLAVSNSITDYGLKARYDIFNLDVDKLSIGLDVIRHAMDPLEINASGIVEDIFPSARSAAITSFEGGLYVDVEKSLTEKLSASLGYRQSFATVDGKMYLGFEPRLLARYKLNDLSSIKFNFTVISQYQHRVSSASLSLPVDLWYSVTRDIKPQRATQFGLGYVKSFSNSGLLFESEVYYKFANNIIEYEEGTNLFLNTDFEQSIVQGTAESYGWEVLLRKKGERLNGWASYTLSWANRQVDGLNGDAAFPARYDRRHNISIVANYKVFDRWEISAVWEYLSGSRFTPVVAQYAITNPLNTGVTVENIYPDRNSVSLSNTHRLDLSLVRKSKPGKKLYSEWRLGVYNVYNRAAPVSIQIEQDAETGLFNYQQPGLFGTLPFISYRFKF
ncbi:MAG: carboxypeptidase-like regulatory domain-containing protein [Reichenbachiella sp.]|uniref:TonB-dependent receptor n=1 Tax=Reichenbachiella sp. TaxID=2184521 RepID=UPI0032669494